GDTATTLFAIGSSTASFASTTLFAVSNTGSTTIANGINITAGCYAVNGTCLATGGTGGSAFPFTPTNNFGALANSTSTPVFFAAGLQASSTSHFANLDYTGTFNFASTSANASSTLMSFGGLPFIVASTSNGVVG